MRQTRPLGGAGIDPQHKNSQKSWHVPILESVKIDLDEDEIRRLIDAVEHYQAYLH